MAVATIYYQAADLILRALGVTPGPVNVNLLVAWMPREYSPSFLAVTNNPLATSLQSTGMIGYCTLTNGERSSEPCYDTLQHGAAACAATLRNGRYPHLLGAIATGNANEFFAGAYSQGEMWVWNGHSYTLAEIQSVYATLPSVPTAYLSTTSTTPKKAATTGTTFIGAAAPYALWGVLGLGGIAAGAVLLDEAGVFRRWRL